ncbi:VPLPA-CTERM sorting domain-containing protein [Oceanicoccus sp. KOV_DT_Chl]|uniref:VPLPA-CTERM sorting domain-containing protein n=1 Tax=Oceanicoccus sp. KOV_DT_Chl TaxID=1904639 RepID=UPI0011AF52FC|nr:VPLPA-CTERM sorting domain-containing protein [Oceanicoccus sp. KOV_DT_Chl]
MSLFNKKTVLALSVILSTFSINALGLTTLVFNVSAEVSRANYTGGLQWTATNNTAFQFTVVYDESLYSVSTEVPPAYVNFIDSVNEGSVVINSMSGASIDAANNIGQQQGVTPTRTGGVYLADSSAFGSSLNSLGFKSTYRTNTQSDVYISEGEQMYQQYNLDNVMSLNFAAPSLPVSTDISTANHFLALLQAQENIDGAFTFRHEVTETLDECSIMLGFCYGDIYNEPLLGGDGIRYQGSATLVSVSQVPVPAAVWLFGSALIGLTGIKRKK